MFIYRHNPYTNKYYTYDSDLYDIFSPMFDDTIHPTDDNFDISYRTNPIYYRTCAFCNTKFRSRNQLFKHLAYMGINIKKQPTQTQAMQEDQDADIELGSMGFSLTPTLNPDRTPPEAIAYSNSRARRARALLKKNTHRSQKKQQNTLAIAFQTLALLQPSPI